MYNHLVDPFLFPFFDHASVTFAGKCNASGLALAISSLAAFVATVFTVSTTKVSDGCSAVLAIFIIFHALQLLPGNKRNGKTNKRSRSANSTSNHKTIRNLLATATFHKLNYRQKRHAVNTKSDKYFPT